ncbi:hypothetical protein CAL7716_060220 [Calothrix sp. PCC 7716]|nr:hypothetical protein CAL7716_060220 [Calothrix sp. PCC 7716]
MLMSKLPQNQSHSGAKHFNKITNILKYMSTDMKEGSTSKNGAPELQHSLGAVII